MILCTDVAYGSKSAIAAGVLFDNWGAEEPLSTHLCCIDSVHPYRSGHFYERELPCLLELLKGINRKLSMILVDGFVWLGPPKPGLRRYLHLALDQKIPIVGIAKNSFANNDLAIPVYRGNSQKALWVTSTGVDSSVAAEGVKSMHGEYRNPTLLKLVDRLCRDGL